MEFKFIAINGDDVGEGIGNAIATDNHEELSKITGSLKEAHAGIEEWAQSKGGEVVTSSGDEAIVKIPGDSFDESELEQIKSQYSETAGHTVTIGTGDSMSEASKALIYGKMNEKDQIVHYDAHIDDYIADYDGDGEDEAIDEDDTGTITAEDEDGDGDIDDVEIEDATDEDLGDDSEEDDAVPQDSPDVENEKYDTTDVPQVEAEFDPDKETPPEETEEDPSSDLMDESAIAEEDDGVPSEDKLKEFTGDEEADITVPADEMVDEHEDLVDTLESESHEDDKQEAQEQAKELEQYKDVEASGEDAFISEDDEAAVPDQDMDGDIDGDDAMAENQQQSALQDMIHANMEEGQEEQADPDELKQRVAQILMSFKENKMALESMKQSNPRVYESLIGMLQSMIDMAKQLNMDPQAEAEAMEAQDALPDAELAPEEGQEEDQEAPVEEEGEEGDEAGLIKKFEDVTKSISEFMRDIRAHSKKNKKVKKAVSEKPRRKEKGINNITTNKVTDKKTPKRGRSWAGDHTREGSKLGARAHAKRVIREQKEMPKPNLPKKEKNVVKSEKKGKSEKK